ncbi:hypothetical protein [Telluria aromaticivorans]|uniref:Uncharacterized protein n=1 Tax=Telluria aromaticivorans TaxID=2725995 RepID=A0A7Y2JZI1_9BURK|nr:hypothetical protein [Telluria aromaticivorans]NNG23842.1 hypothetical protein [Telluria aromaticivorans]
MSTHTKLVIANVLMTIGAIPLVFFVVWLIGILTWTPKHGAIIPIMDPIGMIGPFIMGFIITAAVAGTSAAWSWDLVRANPQNRSRVALVLRLTTVATLISPFAVLFLSRFF